MTYKLTGDTTLKAGKAEYKIVVKLSRISGSIFNVKLK